MKINRNLDEAPVDVELVLVKTVNGKNFPYIGEKCDCTDLGKGIQWLANGVYGAMISETFENDFTPDGWVEPTTELSD